jgi:3-deoxy-manno-octulosonate cytidylyltransferase (CMP-KDO synthetase)
LKFIAVIPARYASTRFPGKPLADICGKPMVQHVYEQVSRVPELDEVVVATDDKRIYNAVAAFGGDAIMTRGDHTNHISRVQEVSDNISSDWYVCVNGDEPLVDPASITTIINSAKPMPKPIFYGAMRSLISPSQTIDNAKIKLAVNAEGRCIYMSRSPVPYPQGSLMFEYKKYMGIECFNKAALDFFVNTPMGQLEKAEDIDHLRFIENDIPLYFIMVESESISVDTPKDLEYVKQLVNVTPPPPPPGDHNLIVILCMSVLCYTQRMAA